MLRGRLGPGPAEEEVLQAVHIPAAGPPLHRASKVCPTPGVTGGTGVPGATGGGGVGTATPIVSPLWCDTLSHPLCLPRLPMSPPSQPQRAVLARHAAKQGAALNTAGGTAGTDCTGRACCVLESHSPAVGESAENTLEAAEYFMGRRVLRRIGDPRDGCVRCAGECLMAVQGWLPIG